MKNIKLAALMILAVAVFAGCGAKKAEVSTITVSSKGDIVLEEIADETSCDTEGLKGYLDEAMDETEGVSLKTCEVKDGKAYIKSTYTSYKPYTEFTGYKFFNGTVLDAKVAGFVFDAPVYAVQNGAVSAEAAADAPAESDTCVVSTQDYAVKVPGTITYVSDVNATVDGDTVTPSGTESEIIIIYK